ncbi:MAG: molybdopterin oxidoreductase family protein, partial [Candidatus Acidiferrales bacterium]
QSLCTIEQLGAAKAILLVGNDPTDQNPLVAWQIRTAVRNGGARLYAINSSRIKLARQARQFVQAAPGAEPSVIRCLATGLSDLEAEQTVDVMALKSALEKESDVVIVFGAEITGARIADLLALGTQLPGHTRYLALGDYSNSRGASDMGLLPDFLPGYARAADAAELKRFARLWGAASLPAQPGLTARQMMGAAASGKLKALYVVGANPAKTFATKLDRLKLLVVQEMFHTETTEYAHVVLPAACAYEKSGTVTNTAGEVQPLRNALETTGTRADFDLLRILSHQLAQARLGKAAHIRSTDAAFDEIRAHVRGYNVPAEALLTGGAELAAPVLARNGHKPYDVPADLIFSSRDTLFTSGTLGRFCTMIRSVPEAHTAPPGEATTE